jgi:hypothetical protein
MPIVKNNKTNVIMVSRTIRLGPGNNQIDDKEWERVQGDKMPPALKAMLDEGTVEVVGGTSGGDTGGAMVGGSTGTTPLTNTYPLAGLNEREATKVVSDTFDNSALETWLTLERRKGVKEAIRKQIAELKALTEEKKPTE